MRTGRLRRLSPVPGTPRWAVVSAWVAAGCVWPASIWRTAVGLGAPLGWTDAHLRLERIPGYGTFYVIWLSAATAVAAALTLGLVYRWGERVPAGIPVLGSRLVPVGLATVLAIGGVVVVSALVVLSVVHWSDVSGFADRPTSGWALLMAACYAPMILWSPLLLAVTLAYVRRRTGRCARWPRPHP